MLHYIILYYIILYYIILYYIILYVEVLASPKLAVRTAPSARAKLTGRRKKGQMGSALMGLLMGSLQISILFGRGTFWVLPLTYLFLSPKCQGEHFFPICPQPRLAWRGRGPPSGLPDLRRPSGEQQQNSIYIYIYLLDISWMSRVLRDLRRRSLSPTMATTERPSRR